MIDILSLSLGVIVGFAATMLFTLFILGWMGGNLDRLEREARALDVPAPDEGL